MIQDAIRSEVSIYVGRGNTASGQRYERSAMTAATSRHRKNGRITRVPVLPFGSVWELKYRGRTVTIKINDTGSYKPSRAKFWFDLTPAAWNKLTKNAPYSRIVVNARRIK